MKKQGELYIDKNIGKFIKNSSLRALHSINRNVRKESPSRRKYMSQLGRGTWKTG